MSPANEPHFIELVEAIHRARNDLAAISAMLQLQARMSDSEAVSDALNAARLRVLAIARVNAALDNTTRAEPMVNAAKFLISMADDLQAAVQGSAITIQVIGGPTVLLPFSYARPLGLVANEWVTNALKYAFPDRRAGVISIALHVENSECRMTVEDNGVGMDSARPPQGTGLGARLTKGLAHQLSGAIKSETRPEGGTSWTMSFPKPDSSQHFGD